MAKTNPTSTSALLLRGAQLIEEHGLAKKVYFGRRENPNLSYGLENLEDAIEEKAPCCFMGSLAIAFHEAHDGNLAPALYESDEEAGARYKTPGSLDAGFLWESSLVEAAQMACRAAGLAACSEPIALMQDHNDQSGVTATKMAAIMRKAALRA